MKTPIKVCKLLDVIMEEFFHGINILTIAANKKK